MRRLLPCLAVLAAAAAGCGGGDSDSDPLDAALGHLPADAPLAVAIQTDPDGDQIRNIGRIVDRFPVGERLLGQLRQQLESGEVDYENDVKPLLGNPLVFGAARVKDVTDDDEKLVGAIKVDDESKAKELLEKSGMREKGEVDGAKIYEGGGDDPVAIDDGVLVLANDRARLEQAVRQGGEDKSFDKQALDDATRGLPGGALFRMKLDTRAFIEADSDSVQARRVPWVGALRDLGLTISTASDKLTVDFKQATDGELGEGELPLASGPESPPVFKRPGEIAAGLRDPASIFKFGEAAGRAVDPQGFQQYERGKETLERQLRVDFERDVVQQFTGDAAANVRIGGSFGGRSELSDPAAFKRTLERLAGFIPRVVDGAAIARPRRGEDFYGLSLPGGGRTIVFGVVDDALVVADDARRAGTLAEAQPSPVEGARGSLVASVDAGLLAQQILSDQLGGGLGGLGAGVAVGPLGDLDASVRTEADGLSGRLVLGFD